MLGEIYENAYVFDLINEEDREKWYETLQKQGLEQADYFSCDDRLDRYDIDGDGMPSGMYMVTEEGETHYTLCPWTCDPETIERFTSENSSLDMMPKKVTCKFFNTPNSDHPMYILFGYPIMVSKKELEKYCENFEVMRFCKDSLTNLIPSFKIE